MATYFDPNWPPGYMPAGWGDANWGLPGAGDMSTVITGGATVAATATYIDHAISDQAVWSAMAAAAAKKPRRRKPKLKPPVIESGSPPEAGKPIPGWMVAKIEGCAETAANGQLDSTKRKRVALAAAMVALHESDPLSNGLSFVIKFPPKDAA